MDLNETTKDHLEDPMENLYTPNCIRTVSGKYVNLVDPDPATLDITDIAHALSRIPRFGGHLPVAYSVAHHSVHVARLCQDHDRRVQFQALMHDASEAYLLDIPKPLKDYLPEYRAIEDRMMRALAQRFGFGWPLHPAVKQADKVALETEWEHLMLLSGGQETIMTDLHPDRTFLQLFNTLAPLETRNL